jgi:hypothetical protein
MIRLLCCAFAALLAVAGFGPAVASTSPLESDAREWQFRVLLDDREIGFHRYEMRREGDTRVVESRAEFDVKFLFFNAYRYRHSLSATWQGRCLESLQTRTDANGRKLAVTGRKSDAAFVVDKGQDVDRLPPCIMNFAYWDPRILEQPRLLNPQTGDYLDVTVEALDEDTVNVGGETIAADIYRIVAKDMRIDIWYAKSDQRWLALESLAKGGRIIRYELI